jgi:hypothetical protein
MKYQLYKSKWFDGLNNKYRIYPGEDSPLDVLIYVSDKGSMYWLDYKDFRNFLKDNALLEDFLSVCEFLNEKYCNE